MRAMRSARGAGSKGCGRRSSTPRGIASRCSSPPRSSSRSTAGRERRYLHRSTRASADGAEARPGAGADHRAGAAGDHRRARGSRRPRAQPTAHERHGLRRAPQTKARQRPPRDRRGGGDLHRGGADGGDRPEDWQNHAVRDEGVRRASPDPRSRPGHRKRNLASGAVPPRDSAADRTMRSKRDTLPDGVDPRGARLGRAGHDLVSADRRGGRHREPRPGRAGRRGAPRADDRALAHALDGAAR